MKFLGKNKFSRNHGVIGNAIALTHKVVTLKASSILGAVDV